MPTITRFAPAAIAASSSSPVPRVVAISGLRCSVRNEHQPRGGGHLDHGGAPVAQQAESGRDRLASRAGDSGFAERAAGGGDQGVDRSFAAVGHGHPIDRRTGHAGSRRAPSLRRPPRQRGSP